MLWGGEQEGISGLLQDVIPETFFFFFPRVLCVAFLITFIFWIIFDLAKRGYQHLISFGGLLMYVFLLFIFSRYPNRVSISSILALWWLLLLLLFLFSVSKSISLL